MLAIRLMNKLVKFYVETAPAMKSKLLLCLALVLSGNCHAAIIFPQAPEEGWQFASNKISQVIQNFPHIQKGLKVQDWTTTNALKVYDFAPQNVISGKLLAPSKFSGWQYLFARGTNAAFCVWMSVDPKDGKLIKRGGVSEGNFYQSILVGLQKAEELPQVQKQDYECRYLSSPFLFQAIWLHGKSDDIIIPLPPTWNEWKAFQPYSEGKIVKLLKPEAENKLKQNPHLPD
jgi:hypothetical protein